MHWRCDAIEGTTDTLMHCSDTRNDGNGGLVMNIYDEYADPEDTERLRRLMGAAMEIYGESQEDMKALQRASTYIGSKLALVFRDQPSYEQYPVSAPSPASVFTDSIPSPESITDYVEFIASPLRPSPNA